MASNVKSDGNCNLLLGTLAHTHTTARCRIARYCRFRVRLNKRRREPSALCKGGPLPIFGALLQGIPLEVPCVTGRDLGQARIDVLRANAARRARNRL